jgi:hypothetical protein
MKSRADYEKALSVVGSEIRRLDPYSLISGGVPNDEFDPEIAKVVARIPKIHSESDAIQVVSEVFSEAFGADGFTPEKCVSVGAALYVKLHELGLVPNYS